MYGCPPVAQWTTLACLRARLSHFRTARSATARCHAQSRLPPRRRTGGIRAMYVGGPSPLVAPLGTVAQRNSVASRNVLAAPLSRRLGAPTEPRCHNGWAAPGSTFLTFKASRGSLCRALRDEIRHIHQSSRSTRSYTGPAAARWISRLKRAMRRHASFCGRALPARPRSPGSSPSSSRAGAG